MSSSIYSRAAFLAQSSLRDRGIQAKKGHLREVVAALHGFGSLAAMQAAEPFGLARTYKSVAVRLEQKFAAKRAADLLVSDPAAVVLEVIGALQDTATTEHFYLNHLEDIPKELRALAKKLALLMPDMQGVVDDYESRVRAAVDRVVDLTGKSIEPAHEKILRKMSENNGPIRLHEEGSRPHPAGRIYDFVGDYTDASGRTGVVHIHIVFVQTGRAVYGRHSAGAVFDPGPTYEEKYGEELHLSENSLIGGMG